MGKKLNIIDSRVPFKNCLTNEAKFNLTFYEMMNAQRIAWYKRSPSQQI